MTRQEAFDEINKTQDELIAKRYFESEYYEQICKHILLVKFSNLYEKLTKEKQHNTDNPIGIDLYEPTKKIGIEVTEAHLDNTYNKAIDYGVKNKYYEDSNYIARPFSMGFRLETKQYDSSIEEQDKFIYDRFIYALENKNNKYDIHYSQFNADLIIHDLSFTTKLSNIQNFINNIINYINTHEIKFNYIYYLGFSDEYTIIIQFNSKTNEYQIEHISNLEMDMISNKNKKYIVRK